MMLVCVNIWALFQSVACRSCCGGLEEGACSWRLRGMFCWYASHMHLVDRETAAGDCEACTLDTLLTCTLSTARLQRETARHVLLIRSSHAPFDRETAAGDCEACTLDTLLTCFLSTAGQHRVSFLRCFLFNFRLSCQAFHLRNFNGDLELRCHELKRVSSGSFKPG